MEWTTQKELLYAVLYPADTRIEHGALMTGVRLAIIGARGIRNHGGFETFVGELAPRLAERGHEVYCSVRESREGGMSQDFPKVRLLTFPLSFPKSYAFGKVFEVLYDSYFVVKCRLFLKCDVVYCLGTASALSLLLTKSSSCKSVVNVDGLEWSRDKFGILARLFLRGSFILSCIGASRLVIDNTRLIEHIPERFRGKAVFIPYGASPVDCDMNRSDRLRVDANSALNLVSGDYWLVVARLEPENNIHAIIKAYLLCGSVSPLVVVGGHSSSGYRKMLDNLIETAQDGKRIIITGPIYDQERLLSIRCGCKAYLHGHSVGGTNPSLLEAMSSGNAVIAHDNVFNREVCSDTALYFRDASTLAVIMNKREQTPSDFANLGRKAKARVSAHYKWDDVVAEHEELFTGGNG